MHRTKTTGRIFWITVSILLLAAVIAGLILYRQIRGRVHDTSGLIPVNMAEKLGAKGK